MNNFRRQAARERRKNSLEQQSAQAQCVAQSALSSISTIEIAPFSVQVPLLKQHKLNSSSLQRSSQQQSPYSNRHPAAGGQIEGKTMLNWKKTLQSLNAEQGMLLENIDSIVYKPRRKVAAAAASSAQSQSQSNTPAGATISNDLSSTLQQQQQLYAVDANYSTAQINSKRSSNLHVISTASNYNNNNNTYFPNSPKHLYHNQFQNSNNTQNQSGMDELYNPDTTNKSPSSSLSRYSRGTSKTLILPPFQNLLLLAKQERAQGLVNTSLPSIPAFNLNTIDMSTLINADPISAGAAAAAIPTTSASFQTTDPNYQSLHNEHISLNAQTNRRLPNHLTHNGCQGSHNPHLHHPHNSHNHNHFTNMPPLPQYRSLSIDSSKDILRSISSESSTMQLLGFQRYHDQQSQLQNSASSKKLMTSSSSNKELHANNSSFLQQQHSIQSYSLSQYPQGETIPSNQNARNNLMIISNQSLLASKKLINTCSPSNSNKQQQSQSSIQQSQQMLSESPTKNEMKSRAGSPSTSPQSPHASVQQQSPSKGSACILLRTDLPSRKHALILPRMKVMILDEIVSADDIYRSDWIRVNLEKYWLQLLNESVSRVTDFDLLQRVQPYAREILSSEQYKVCEDQWSGGRYVLGECSKWNLLKQIQMYEQGHLNQSKFYTFITHYFLPPKKTRELVFEMLIETINKRLVKNLPTTPLLTKIFSIFDVNGFQIKDLYELDLTSTVLLAGSSHVQVLPAGLKSKLNALHVMEQKKYFANYQKAKLQSAFVVVEESPTREKKTSNKSAMNTMKLPQILLRSSNDGSIAAATAAAAVAAATSPVVYLGYPNNDVNSSGKK